MDPGRTAIPDLTTLPARAHARLTSKLEQGIGRPAAAWTLEDLATMVKRTEEGGPRLSAQLPTASADAEPPPPAPAARPHL